MQVCGAGRAAPCFSEMKSIAGWSPLAVHPALLPGCCVPVPAGSVLCPFFFSSPSAAANSPERLPPQHRVSTWGRKQEGEKPKPSLQQHKRNRIQLVPSCRHSVTWPLLSGALGAPLGASRHWGLLVPSWGGGRMRNAGLCTRWGLLSLYGQGHQWQGSPNPIVSDYKAVLIPLSHLRSKQRASGCFEL